MGNVASLASLAAAGSLEAPRIELDNPVKIRQAAQEFEGLLLEEVLQSSKGGSSWLQSGESSSDDCATGLAEQQLALALARNGGMGLSNMIAKALEERE
jgi:Rod binding domain-containing protein